MPKRAKRVRKYDIYFELECADSEEAVLTLEIPIRMHGTAKPGNSGQPEPPISIGPGEVVLPDPPTTQEPESIWAETPIWVKLQEGEPEEVIAPYEEAGLQIVTSEVRLPSRLYLVNESQMVNNLPKWISNGRVVPSDRLIVRIKTNAPSGSNIQLSVVGQPDNPYRFCNSECSMWRSSFCNSQRQ